MILDTSAAIALLRGEAGHERILAALDRADRVAMSAASVLELALVTSASGPALVDDFLAAMSIEVLPVDQQHLRWARAGHEAYGRGSGSPARLNFGDCLSYGAAKATGEPLLFVGDDFGHTDLRSGLD